MKLLLSLLFTAVSVFSYDQTSIKAKCDAVLVRKAYTTCYDYGLHSPHYSAYTLDKKIDITTPRLETFYTDKDIPSDKRTSNSQFTGTGYDKGHLFPASFGDWSEQSRIETNLLSNIVPQQPKLNRSGAWRDTEVAEETLVHQYNSIFVVSGAIYNGMTTPTGLSVPQYMYKIIVVPGANKMTILLYSNMVNTDVYTTKSLMTDVKTIEALTHIKFNLPSYKLFTESELNQIIKH